MNTVSKFSKNYSNDEIQSSEVPLYWRLFDNQKKLKRQIKGMDSCPIR